MSDLNLDLLTGDAILDEGNFELNSGIDAVRQHLKQRLQTFLGEWFLDNRVGVPYYEHILIKNPNPSVLDTVFKSVILNTPGILELIEFDIDLDEATRQMTLVFKANTVDGEIDFSQVLGVF